jgi:glycosyltransferase involved in cell wall biosynthesis
MKIISFCIPTYNRANKIFELVNNILQFCNSNKFEIIVLNNCSNDNTLDKLSVLKDERLKVFTNKLSLSGPLNIIKSLSLSTSRFSLLCLDKDFINPHYIDLLIQKLENNNEISFGKCEINNSEFGLDKIFDKGFESLYNMSYLSEHPSGLIYNNTFLKSNQYFLKILSNQYFFSFYPDIINAEMSTLGKSILFKIPLIKTESLKDCEEIQSFTFKNEDDLYFTPNNRFQTLLAYSSHLVKEVNLTEFDKIIILKKLYRKQIAASTSGYKHILNNPSICKHHYIHTRNVSNIELINIYLKFCFKYIISNLDINISNKLNIIISQSYLIFLNFKKKQFD